MSCHVYVIEPLATLSSPQYVVPVSASLARFSIRKQLEQLLLLHFGLQQLCGAALDHKATLQNSWSNVFSRPDKPRVCDLLPFFWITMQSYPSPQVLIQRQWPSTGLKATLAAMGAKCQDIVPTLNPHAGRHQQASGQQFFHLLSSFLHLSSLSESQQRCSAPVLCWFPARRPHRRWLCDWQQNRSEGYSTAPAPLGVVLRQSIKRGVSHLQTCCQRKQAQRHSRGIALFTAHSGTCQIVQQQFCQQYTSTRFKDILSTCSTASTLLEAS